MSDVIKWGLLAAAIVAMIAMIVILPFNNYMNFGAVGSAVSSIVSVCGNAFAFARGLINNFLSPFGRTALTGLMAYLFGKFFITLGVKVVSWVYHFVFRG